MWTEGTFKINNREYKYFIKKYETSSRYGVQRGKISKLDIKYKGKIIFSYDRGWSIKSTDKKHLPALDYVLNLGR